MSATTPTFGPPMLGDDWLKTKLLMWYPSHKTRSILIEQLVEEYKRFWRLILNFPQRRVVAPGPVMAVQRVHQSDAPRYFNDCMTYFNQFKRPDELAWRGHTDYVGTSDTIMAYQHMFKASPHIAWIDMSHLVNFDRTTVRLLRS